MLKRTLRLSLLAPGLLSSVSCVMFKDGPDSAPAQQKKVGFDKLVDHIVDSHRYYSIPDEIRMGKQYTFHIGIDLSSVYSQITFAPSVSDWENKIYENNDEF